MTVSGAELSAAIVLYLKHYPGRNEDEFRATITAEADRDAVRAVLDETLRTRVDWGQKSLGEIGDEVREVVRRRHPELSDAALEKLGNYFTYLVK